MISYISPVLTQPLAPARAEQPAPPAPPAPAPQPDTLDFSKIDCPVKAALLPINEPALQLGLAAGVMFAVLAGAHGGAIPLITLELASKSADKLTNVTYSLDLKDQQNPLSVSGDVDGQAVSDSFSLDEKSQTAKFSGAIGASKTELSLGLDEDTQALKVSGKLGDVDVNLSYSAIMDPNGKDGLRGLHTEGTLGGQAYSVDTRFDTQKLTRGGSKDEPAKMTVRGKLGDADISKDYTISTNQMPSGAEIDVAGSGTTAGVPQEVNMKLTLVG